MSSELASGGGTAKVVVKALSRTADIVWFVVSAPLVLVATIGCGGWLGMAFLDALVELLDHATGDGALRLVLSLAGVLGVLVVFRAWCALLRRHDSTIGRSRWQVATVAVLATVATIRATLTTHPEASRFHQYSDQPPTMHTNWFPAVLLGILAMSAAVLMLVPGSVVVDIDRVQRRHRVGPRLRHAFRLAADRLRIAGVAALGVLARAARRGSIDTVRLAAALRPAPHARLGMFLLLLPPVLVAIVPVAIITLVFGGFAVFYFGAATLIVPPALIAALLAIVLLVALLASFVATLQLWFALLRDAGSPRLRTRALAAFGVAASLVGAWVTRNAPDNTPLSPHLQIAGMPIAPLAIAAFDGAALLLVHAIPRWSAAVERALRVLAVLALAGLAGAWFLRDVS